MDDQSGEPPLAASQPDAALEEDAAGARCAAASAVTSPPCAMPPSPLGRRPGRPWGFWATVGWTALLLVAWYALAHVFSLVIYSAIALLADILPASPETYDLYHENEGLVRLVFVLFMAPPMLALIALLSGVRRIPLRTYLALNRPRPKETFVTLTLLLALLASMDVVTRLLGQPITPWVDRGFMLTAGSVSLFVVVGSVVGPLLEEVWWRGFVFHGIAASKAGPILAVILPAVPFAMMHYHYDRLGMFMVFLIGLFLGAVRWRTGSTTLAVICHAAANLYALVKFMTETHLLADSGVG
jgi:membrane protease YdiL (CAAX protease family)